MSFDRLSRAQLERGIIDAQDMMRALLRTEEQVKSGKIRTRSLVERFEMLVTTQRSYDDKNLELAALKLSLAKQIGQAN